MKNLIQSIAKNLGYKIEKIKIDPVIVADKDFMKIYFDCKDYTMTSIENMYQLYLSVKYIISKNIKGDFVECGVWKGGSIMVIALTLNSLRINNRKIWLYDTFEGMSEPTNKDITINGQSAIEILDTCFCSMRNVRINLYKIIPVTFDTSNFIFIKGKVEDTLKKEKPNKICLLRLDTDWYESTKEELKVLYPLLEKDGVLIIDDYGTWKGSKKAVDDYFKDEAVLLNRIDGTARLIIK